MLQSEVGTTDLDNCLAEPGRDDLVRQVRDKIDELGVVYIYFEYISITGRIMGKAVPSRHWEEVAAKGVSERLEVVFVFVREQDVRCAQEAVLYTVAASNGFTFGGDGAAAFCAIAAVGGELGLGRHAETS